MKYMLEKHEGWHGAMVWPHRAQVKFWEALADVVMHAIHKSNHHRGIFMVLRGKSARLKGPRIQISFLPYHSVFSTIKIPPRMQRVQIWYFSGPIYHIRGLCAFSRH
jgi:hypothetical protein